MADLDAARPMTTLDVTRTYLDMARPEDLIDALAADPAVRVERTARCSPALYRLLYGEVGRDYAWTDRLRWSDEQLAAHLSRSEIGIWIMRVGDATAGWFELERHADGSVEIAYFGVLPTFHRRGLGKHLLSVATREAWAPGATRVWLHTCTLDDPAALPNYIKRGFRPYREERYTVDQPPG